jgi:cholesterol oxidase
MRHLPFALLKDGTADKNPPAEQAAQKLNQIIIARGMACSVDDPQITGLTVHPVGGCELGKATDLYGRVCGYQGLYAVDGSIVPGNIGGAKPSLRIAAMAERSLANIIFSGG